MACAIDTLEEDGEYIKLPDTWPTEDALKSDSVTFVDVHNEKLLQFCKKAMFGNPSVYPMKNLIRGNVLVINNETFVKLQHRTGTEQDCNKIRAVFSQLGFNVIIYNNLTSCEMKQTLMRESKHNYSNHDCFILFILSHGDSGVVLGTDANTESGSNSLSIVHIRRLFSQNKSLLGKPKLLFIQACQGGQCDKGQALDDEPSPASHLNIGRSPIKSEQSDSPHSEAVNSRCDEDEETADGAKLPSESDIFLSTATVEGFVSWRHTAYGSWYIQAICYVFRMYAYKHDLNDLMTLVNNLVSKSETAKEQFKQVATKYDTLRKKLFLFPCLHEPYVDIIHKYREGQREKDNLKQQFESVSLHLKTLKEKCKLLLMGQTETLKEKFTLLLVGRTGNGKSSVGNSILGQDDDNIKFEPRRPSEVKKLKNEIAFNDEFVVVDCSGIGDTTSEISGDMSSIMISAFDALIINNNIKDGLNPVKQPTILQRCGFDVLLFVMKYGAQFSKQEKDAIQMVKSIFGEDVFRDWGILVFSHGDNFNTDTKESRKSFDNWCKEERGEIKSLLEEVRYRCVLFDNKTKDKEKQEKQRCKLNEHIISLKGQENVYFKLKKYSLEDFLSICTKHIEEKYNRLRSETEPLYTMNERNDKVGSNKATLQLLAKLKKDLINLWREIIELMKYFSWKEKKQVYVKKNKPTPVKDKEDEPRQVKDKEDEPKPVTDKEDEQTPVKDKEDEQTPVKDKEDERRTIKDKEGDRTPVKDKEDEPTPVKAKEDEPTPVKAKEDEPTPVKAKEDEPTPVKAKEDEPTPVKAKEDEPTPVKAKEDEPTPVKDKEDEPTPVKAKEDEPTPVKAKDRELEKKEHRPMQLKEEHDQFKLNRLHYVEFRRYHQCQFDIKHEIVINYFTDFLNVKKSRITDKIKDLVQIERNNRCILS